MIWRGDGLRAALEVGADRWRLVGVSRGRACRIAQPVMVRGGAVRSRRSRAVLLVLIGPITSPRVAYSARSRDLESAGNETSKRRAIYVYPWLIPAFAILHYLATNVFLLRPYEAIIPSLLILTGVTVVFIALRIALQSGASAALLTGMLGIAFFAYGHVYDPPEPPDSRVLGIAFPIGYAIPYCGAKDEFALESDASPSNRPALAVDSSQRSSAN